MALFSFLIVQSTKVQTQVILRDAKMNKEEIISTLFSQNQEL